VNVRQLADRLQLAAGGAMRAELGKRLRNVATAMESAGRDNAKARMKTRSGLLRRSIGGFVRSEGAPRGGIGPLRQGADIEVGVQAGGVILQGAEVVYAGIQERGGTVRPVRRRWLAIPTDSVKTKDGVSQYKTPRDFPRPLRFVQFRPDLAALIEVPRRKAKKAPPARRQRVARVERRPRRQTRQRGSLGPVRWWLVKQTTIKAKWYLRDAFEGDVLSSALEGLP
jgi:hypothetical protein